MEDRSVLEVRAQIERDIEGDTVCSGFARTVDRRPDAVALRWREGDDWGTWTWADYAEQATRVAAGLRELGLQRGERVALLLRNRPDFHALDMGTLLAGGTPFSLYNSSAPEQIRHLLAHSGAVAVAVEEGDLLERVEKVRPELPNLRHVVVVGTAGDRRPDAHAFEDLRATAPLDLGAAAAAVEPHDAVTVIYTSGTTGAPKGVVLTQANLRYAVEIYVRVMGISMEGFRQISYLPMAHVAERLATHYFHVLQGSVVTTCEDLAQLPAYMRDVRPEWWFCAPRLWEKLQAGIEAGLMDDAEKRRAFDDARQVGWEVFRLVNDDRPVPPELAASWEQARRDVVAPVLAGLGLDDVKCAITGSAPLPRATFEFFVSCGLPLSDCYGQSETTGFISWSPTRIVPGTSGRPFPGVEVRLDGDGEILVRGPNVFAGYLDAPDLTEAAFDADGWLRTGDIGEIDAEANLRVIDRKKEIIVPSSGHKVSPVALEAALKEAPLVGQVCVVGDGRPHLAALVVLDPDVARPWARQRGIEAASLRELAGHPDVVAEVQRAVDRVNDGVARSEQIRSFTVLGDEWLPDSDLLTPTAKLKRRGVQARYADEIERLYGERV